MSIHAVWFWNDYRTTDHEPLLGAIDDARADGGGVLPIVILDPFHFGKTRFGFERIGDHRRKFLRESIIDLRDRIADLGARLAVVEGDTVATFDGLMDRLPIRSLRFHHQYAPEEQKLQRQVLHTAKLHGVPIEVSQPNTLMTPDDLPFEVEDTPEVFSQFRRLVEKKGQFGEPQPAPESIPAIAEADWQFIDTVNPAMVPCLQSDDQSADDRAVLEFVGGETMGLTRLSDYLWKSDAIARYKETRNGMVGPDYSSKFSTWLAHGCLSARHIASEVHRYEDERVANDSTYWMIFELLWRDYFAWMLAKHGNAMFQLGGLRREPLPWLTIDENFDRWQAGQTGYPLIDANMRELARTGFMSNRGRQNVGSFLTKNLFIDWRIGAEWFESALNDYDPASNYGNWNYVAGVGNDARGFRWFNTIKQSRDYDPDGDYVRLWCPELKNVPTRYVHEPWKMPPQVQSDSGCVIGRDYPEPIVDLFESAERHRRIYEKTVGGNKSDRRGASRGHHRGRTGRHRRR